MEFVGMKIINIRPMTKKELKEMYWDEFNSFAAPIAIELEKNIVLFASRDEEGNGPGDFVFFNKKSKESYAVGFKNERSENRASG
jgi:hypothetical protein